MSSNTVFDRHSLAILATTLLWGTYWIPLRKLDELGGGSIVFTGAGFLLPLVIMLPVLCVKLPQLLRTGPAVWILGLTFGIAGTFYAEGALRGNVARVILLFYLTPVWSTLLARFMLGEPVTRRRLLTLVLGLLGMYVILGADNSLPIPQTASEWLGLLAGVSWGLAMVYVQKSRGTTVADMATLVFLFYVLSFAALSLIPGGRSWDMDWQLSGPVTIVWILALALVWNLPAVVLTLFGAVEVEPGKVAILLMFEVIIGIGSAALLTDEPFGITEILGAILIIGAGVVEFVPWPADRKPTPLN